MFIETNICFSDESFLMFMMFIAAIELYIYLRARPMIAAPTQRNTDHPLESQVEAQDLTSTSLTNNM